MFLYFTKKQGKTPFFQAEDGIRDRSPSRGLGDVYKRQQLNQIYLKTTNASRFS